jgi:CubicO group peptidase (beta-lactamase class C family)
MRKQTLLQLVIIFVCLPLILYAGPHIRQESVSLKLEVAADTLIKELEMSIPTLMQEANIPGLQIAVIREGKLLWHDAFGIKNTQTQEPVRTDTVFEAASLTKPFFAYLALKMVERGELDLDKPLIECAPQKYIENRYIRHSMDLEGFRSDWFRRITARMVLSHSSGLPHGGPRHPLPILFEPGSEYRYSADGYMYLQRIIEHKKDKALDEIMLTEVIVPLKMSNSSMVWQDRYKEQSAVGHNVFGETTGKFRRRRYAHSAASLYTTAEDYAKFVAAMLNSVGLKKKTLDLMLTPQIDVDDNIYWSLGFGIDRFAEGDAFWQWGDYGIFRNYIMAFKKQKIAVVYFTNSFNGLGIGPTLIGKAIGVDNIPGLKYLGYTRYDSPVSQLTQMVHRQGMEPAVARYSELRKEDPENFGEAAANSLGYALLNADKYDEAIVFFKLNMEAYPLSANACDSLAEAYMQSRNYEMAVKYYRKTLEMIPKDPRPDKEFLKNLKEGAQRNLTQLEKLKKTL